MPIPSSNSRGSKYVLNLRGMIFDHNFDLNRQIELAIDQFVFPLLTNHHANQPNPRIVVGRGLNSKKSINGKNPLRHFTETYLTKLNLTFNNAPEWDGSDGVIVIQLH